MKPIQKAAVAALIVAIILIAAMGITAFAYHPMNTVMSDQGPVNHKDLPYYNTTVNGKKVEVVNLSLAAWGQGNGYPDAYPYNFNGTSYGAMTIYLPANADIHAKMTNYEVKPHTLKIELPYPSQWKRGPIWAHTSAHVKKVINSTGTILPIWYGNVAHSKSIWWNDTQAGNYWIVCGLTTHAEAGMYVYVIVSSNVTVPYYTIK
ncbi:sulfocyanin [Acidiplasma aeolicum]|uniref:Sulfocyanin n=1 Tax=Acidiplasma aeolicum TaxID=507754 RepID=A0A0P9GZF7_9ARCH|nr:sulfocyanin [Acidiplasma aeolicum]KPV47007.1 sulfocyanin [Acidiplasma aeolicum]KQB35058.1 sulfocyanin [Acidiplasma aeolicum]